MTDRPIPPKIRERAVNLADTIILEREVNGQTEGYTNWVVGMISAALLSLQEETEARIKALLKDPAAVRVNWLRGDIAADFIRDEERERCARIAENNNSWPREGEEIAAEIRREPIMQELADEAQAMEVIAEEAKKLRLE